MSIGYIWVGMFLMAPNAEHSFVAPKAQPDQRREPKPLWYERPEPLSAPFTSLSLFDSRHIFFATRLLRGRWIRLNKSGSSQAIWGCKRSGEFEITCRRLLKGWDSGGLDGRVLIRATGMNPGVMIGLDYAAFFK